MDKMVSQKEILNIVAHKYGLSSIKQFENTSSTKLELQTLLWALNEIEIQNRKIIIYTDSQNIISLQGRRNRFEQNNYYTKKNKLITNYKLYQEFFRLIDLQNIEIHKIKGHKQTSNKDYIDQLFTLVDRASRNALRKHKP